LCHTALDFSLEQETAVKQSNFGGQPYQTGSLELRILRKLLILKALAIAAIE